MNARALLHPPELSLRWTAVWRRNQLVWRKLAIASVLGNIADPLLYMVALGYGIGAFQTRELIRMAGGDLVVISEKEFGTTMRIILPLVPEREPAASSAGT